MTLNLKLVLIQITELLTTVVMAAIGTLSKNIVEMEHYGTMTISMPTACAAFVVAGAHIRLNLDHNHLTQDCTAKKHVKIMATTMISAWKLDAAHMIVNRVTAGQMSVKISVSLKLPIMAAPTQLSVR